MNDNSVSFINAIVRQHTSISVDRLKQLFMQYMKYALTDDDLRGILQKSNAVFHINTKGMIEIREKLSSPPLVSEVCRTIYGTSKSLSIEDVCLEFAGSGRYNVEEIAIEIAQLAQSRQDLFLFDEDGKILLPASKGILAILEYWSIELYQILRNEELSLANEIFLSLIILKRYLETDLPGYLQKYGQPRTRDDFRNVIKGIGALYPESSQVFESLANWLEKMPIGVIQHFNRIRLDVNTCPDFIFAWFLCRFIGSIPVRFSIKGRESTTATLLSSLIIQLARPNVGESVFDLAAGAGTTLILAGLINNGIFISGQEFHSAAVRISKLLLLGSGYSPLNITQGDSIISSPPARNSFDVIISDLPFGSKIPVVEHHEIGLAAKDADSAFIIQSVLSLKSKGRAVLTVSNGFLGRESNAINDPRKWLLENDFLEAVISLPTGFGGYSNLSTHLLVLNKDKRTNRKKKVLFINGEQIAKRTTNTVWHYIEDIYHITQPSKDHSRIADYAFVDHGEIIYNSFNLQPLRYANNTILKIRHSLVNANAVRLSEIISTHAFKGFSPINLANTTIRYIRVADLSPEEGDYILPNDSGYPISENINVKGKIVDRPAILVSLVGNRLKPTWFTFENQIPIVVNNNILPIGYNEQVIDPEYLIAQLNQEYFLLQTELIAKGAAMPFFAAKDFWGLRIEILPLSGQKEQVALFQAQIMQSLRNSLREKTKHFKQLENESSVIAESRLIELFGMLKHNLMQKLSTAHTDLTVLKGYLERESSNSNSLDSKIAQPLNGEDPDRIDSVGAVINRAERSIKFGMDMLESTEKNLDYKFSPDKNESVNLNDFLKTDILPVHSGNGKYKIAIDGVSKHRVKMNRGAFRDAIENLIGNAIRHGFIEERDALYRIQFIISEIDGERKLKLTVKNDGIPFPELFSKERFFIMGEKAGRNAGTGLGGAFIKRVLDDMKGTIRILEVTDPFDPYKVQFELHLPIAST